VFLSYVSAQLRKTEDERRTRVALTCARMLEGWLAGPIPQAAQPETLTVFAQPYRTTRASISAFF